jgi:hypothetical protein
LSGGHLGGLPENAPRLTEAQRRDLVMRVQGGVAIAPRRLAEWIDGINTALHSSNTWGEFGRRMPKAEYIDLVERQEIDVTHPEDPFDAFQVSGVGDGDYPWWVCQTMESWIPREVLARHGQWSASVLNGEFWNIEECQAKAIAADLRELGFSVERRSDLEFC